MAVLPAAVMQWWGDRGNGVGSDVAAAGAMVAVVTEEGGKAMVVEWAGKCAVGIGGGDVGMQWRWRGNGGGGGVGVE
jgi:hypothetical protein